MRMACAKKHGACLTNPSCIVHPNVMERKLSNPNKTMPSSSLSALFDQEQMALRDLLSVDDTSAERAVILTREALDRTARSFQTSDDAIQVQKTGLWLLEMVKSGAGVLDRAAQAEIVWTEVPKNSVRVIAGSSLFYGAAFMFFILGLTQESRSTMMAAFVLAALRFFDPKDWSSLWRKIPFVSPIILRVIGKKLPPRLEAPTGQSFEASTRISIDGAGYVDAIRDALHTADHVLSRLSEPKPDAHWQEDKRLIGFLQTLLEAAHAGDGDFALKLIDQELTSVLAGNEIEVIEYTKKTKSYFDVLPSLSLDDDDVKTPKGPQQASPALAYKGEVIRRGTVWQAGQTS